MLSAGDEEQNALLSPRGDEESTDEEIQRMITGSAALHRQRRRGGAQARVAAAVGLLFVLALVSLGWRGTGQGDRLTAAVEAVEGKASETPRQLVVEGNLAKLVTAESVGGGAAKVPSSASACGDQARALFKKVLAHSGLDEELEKSEAEAFQERFQEALVSSCSKRQAMLDEESSWLEAAGAALESQKPMMTRALAESLNQAKYAFKAEMQDWMLHESKESFQSRLGRSEELPKDAVVSTPKAMPGVEELPESFNGAEHWPHCEKEILRIHDQGHCGSCWAFSCSQVLDARTCVSTHSKFDGQDAVLSPGFFASCAAGGGKSPGNGCNGGWEFYCYIFVDRQDTVGAVSEVCDPYFGVGEGVEHFDISGAAPECPAACQANYSRTLEEDGFREPGISNYQLIIKPDQDGHLAMRRAIYEGGMVNFGIYAYWAFFGYDSGIFDRCTAYSANHAVVSYGFFAAKGELPSGYLAKNSWGTNWGDEGRFKIADCIVTDFTTPGKWSANKSHIPYPLGKLTR